MIVKRSLSKYNAIFILKVLTGLKLPYIPQTDNVRDVDRVNISVWFLSVDKGWTLPSKIGKLFHIKKSNVY